MAEFEIKAMLAHKYNPDKADYPAYIQPKLDGVRCLFTAKGAFSRTGKQFMNLRHIEVLLEAFFAANPNAVLDGELYNHELKDDFEKIISLVRKTKPTAEHRQEAAELVQYHVYDVPSMTIAGYSSRLSYLISLFGKVTWPIMHVETKVVLDYDEAVKQHKKYLKLGYEGSILSLIHI